MHKIFCNKCGHDRFVKSSDPEVITCTKCSNKITIAMLTDSIDRDDYFDIDGDIFALQERDRYNDNDGGFDPY